MRIVLINGMGIEENASFVVLKRTNITKKLIKKKIAKIKKDYYEKKQNRYMYSLINSINQPTTVNNIYLEQNQEPQRKPAMTLTSMKNSVYSIRYSFH